MPAAKFEITRQWNGFQERPSAKNFKNLYKVLTEYVGKKVFFFIFSLYVHCWLTYLFIT